MERTVLVTGALGFIGKRLCSYLNAHGSYGRVVGLDAHRPEASLDGFDSELVLADVASPLQVALLFNRLRPDAVVNCAAETHNDRAIVDPTIFWKTNVMGTQCLLETCRVALLDLERFVQVSTCEVYGDAYSTLPVGSEMGSVLFDEGSPLNAKTPYSASKAAGDLVTRSYMMTYPRMPIVLTHCGNNFGPRQHAEKLIPATIHRLLSGEKAKLYGGGRQVRDWVWIDDHCSAIVDLLEAPYATLLRPEGKLGHPAAMPIFDVSAGVEKSNLEIVHLVASALAACGCQVPEDFVEHVADRPNHDVRYAISNRKLAARGWTPSCDGTNFAEYITRTVRWYVDNRDAWRPRRDVWFDWSDVEVPGR